LKAPKLHLITFKFNLPIMSRYLIPLYWTLALIEIYGEHTLTEPVILAVKPLLLTVLSLWFYLECRSMGSRFSGLVLAGLIFSIGGDTLLMFVEYGPRAEQFFLFGLGSFLVAQVCYAVAFWTYPGAKSGDIRQKPWRALPFLLYLVGILGMLWAGIPVGMKVPVAVYAAAIVAMAMGAFNLRGRLSREHFLGLMAGVLLFVLSDSLIAANKFGQPVPNARVLIMSTYLLGQYFIARNAAAIRPEKQAG
jgi:uncharacterized membrane protein YhhN